MATSSASLATVVTALIGILGVLAAEFKCLCEFENGVLKVFSIGLLDHPRVSDEQIELNDNLNGSDLVYVSKSTIQVTDTNTSDDDDVENGYVADEPGITHPFQTRISANM